MQEILFKSSLTGNEAHHRSNASAWPNPLGDDAPLLTWKGTKEKTSSPIKYWSMQLLFRAFLAIMPLAQALFQCSVVCSVYHCLACIEINFYATVLLSTSSSGIASHRIRASLAFNLLELTVGNATRSKVVNHALCTAVAQRDIDTVVTCIVGVAVDINMAVAILFKYL